MLSEKDLSGSGKVCKAFPYIYIYIYICVCAHAHARACVGLFFKLVKLKIWPCLIEFCLMRFCMQRQIYSIIIPPSTLN